MTTTEDHGIWAPALPIVTSWIAVGASLVLGELVPWVQGTLLLADFSPVLVAAIGTVVTAGGVTELAGLLSWRHVSRQWTLERAGCVMTAAGWAAYGAAITAAVENMSIGLLLAIGVIGGSICRYLRVRRESRQIRQAVADHGIQPEV